MPNNPTPRTHQRHTRHRHTRHRSHLDHSLSVSLYALSFDEFVEYYNSYISQNRRSFEDTYKVTAHLGKGAFATVK